MQFYKWAATAILTINTLLKTKRPDEYSLELRPKLNRMVLLILANYYLGHNILLYAHPGMDKAETKPFGITLEILSGYFNYAFGWFNFEGKRKIITLLVPFLCKYLQKCYAFALQFWSVLLKKNICFHCAHIYSKPERGVVNSPDASNKLSRQYYKNHMLPNIFNPYSMKKMRKHIKQTQDSKYYVTSTDSRSFGVDIGCWLLEHTRPPRRPKARHHLALHKYIQPTSTPSRPETPSTTPHHTHQRIYIATCFERILVSCDHRWAA